MDERRCYCKRGERGGRGMGFNLIDVVAVTFAQIKYMLSRGTTLWNIKSNSMDDVKA